MIMFRGKIIFNGRDQNICLGDSVTDQYSLGKLCPLDFQTTKILLLGISALIAFGTFENLIKYYVTMAMFIPIIIIMAGL